MPVRCWARYRRLDRRLARATVEGYAHLGQFLPHVIGLRNLAALPEVPSSQSSLAGRRTRRPANELWLDGWVEATTILPKAGRDLG